MTKNFWVYFLLPCLLVTGCGAHQTQSTGAGNLAVTTSPKSSTSDAPVKEELIFYGKWKIDHVMARAPINGLTQELVNHFLGEEVEFTANTFTSDKVLNNPKYSITYLSAKAFWKETSIDPKNLGMEGDKILKLEVDDPTNSRWFADAAEVYVKDKNTMMFEFQNGMFAMIRE